MKTVLMVGQRDSVLEIVRTHPAVSQVQCIAVGGSHLEQSARSAGIAVTAVERTQKQAAVAAMMAARFDILLSVGCPWLLPIEQLRAQHPAAVFWNVHPSCLPRLRGNHPINGAILFDEPRIGATVHVMEQQFDTGRIIAQVCIERTSDLDLGLLYALSRMIEAEALQAALDAMATASDALVGTQQVGQPSYYTRRAEDMQCNAAHCTTEDLVRRVRAFGISTQGCIVTVAGGGTIRALDAEPIVNSYVCNRFRHAEAGTVVLEYDEHLLVRTRDGIVKLRGTRQ